MRLRTRARYSLRMVMAIGKLGQQRPYVGLRDVSEHCTISRRYLEQLVGPQKAAGLLRAQTGRKGGYALAKAAEEIRVGDVIEAAIGPISVAECIADPDHCVHDGGCHCRGLWELINHRIMQVLNDYTLADLLSEDWEARVAEELGKN